MACNFSGHIESAKITTRIEDREMPKSESFHYLDSIISKDREIDENVEHRIKAGWVKWRLAAGVLCDRWTPTRLKEEFYRIAIRLAMTYGAECWPIKKQHMYKMDVVEMRMLR